MTDDPFTKEQRAILNQAREIIPFTSFLIGSFIAGRRTKLLEIEDLKAANKTLEEAEVKLDKLETVNLCLQGIRGERDHLLKEVEKFKATSITLKIQRDSLVESPMWIRRMHWSKMIVNSKS